MNTIKSIIIILLLSYSIIISVQKKECNKKHYYPYVGSIEYMDNDLKALIDGKEVVYYAASSNLNEAKEYYKNSYPEYLGSGHIVYVNGIKQEFDELMYFFK